MVQLVEFDVQASQFGLGDGQDVGRAMGAAVHDRAPSVAGRASFVGKKALGNPTDPAAAGSDDRGVGGRAMSWVALPLRRAWTARRMAACWASTPMMLAVTFLALASDRAATLAT